MSWKISCLKNMHVWTYSTDLLSWKLAHRDMAESSVRGWCVAECSVYIWHVYWIWFMGTTPPKIYTSDSLADIPSQNQNDIKICVSLKSQTKQREEK